MFDEMVDYIEKHGAEQFLDMVSEAFYHNGEDWVAGKIEYIGQEYAETAEDEDE